MCSFSSVSPFPDWETPDNVHAILDCGTFSISFNVQFMNGHGGDGVAFHGLEGAIIQENDKRRLVHYNPKGEEVEAWPVGDEGRGHMQNFLDRMKDRQTPNSPVTLANEVLVGAHLANESYRSGKRVEWNPETWSRKG